VINVWSLGEGGTAGSWDVFLRTHQHAHDINYLDAAVTALQRGLTAKALKAWKVFTPWNGVTGFNRSAYLTVLAWMNESDQYWGAVWDHNRIMSMFKGYILG